MQTTNEKLVEFQLENTNFPSELEAAWGWIKYAQIRFRDVFSEFPKNDI